MTIHLTNNALRLEAARVLRHVRVMARARDDYVLSARAWRNRAAIEVANRHYGSLAKVRRCSNPQSIATWKRAALIWDMVGNALERGWNR